MNPTVVEIAFLNNAWTVTPTWTDVSADVERVDVRRGRPARGYAADIGRAVVTLRNTIGDYDPEGERGRFFSSGWAFYTHPGKRLRVRHAGATIFDGLIARVAHALDDAPETVVIEAMDRTATLQQFVKTFVAETASEDALVASTLAFTPFTIAWWQTPGSGWLTLALPPETTTLGARLNRIAQSGFGQLFVSRDGLVTYRPRTARYDAPVAILTNDTAQKSWMLGTSRIGHDTTLRPPGWTVGTYEGRRIVECGVFEHNASDIINVARITRTGGVTQTASSASYPGNDSLTKYDTRLYEASDLSLVSDSDALTITQWLTLEYSQYVKCPVSATFRIAADLQALATLDLFDVVEVRVTPRTTHPTRYAGTIVTRALVSSLEWSLTPVDCALTVGLEAAWGASAFRVAVDEISGAYVIV